MIKLIRKLTSKIFLLLLVLVGVHSISLANQETRQEGFFQQRYQGWYWFEKDKTQVQALAPQEQITAAQAKVEIEQFAQELQELKFLMLARPSVENVRNYRGKEQEMWRHAEQLHDAWDMANLLHPQQRDLINNPVNVHAVKVSRQLESENNAAKIKELAQDFDLVLFFSSACRYCQLLSPVLKDFADKYGFNIEAISVDGSQHEYFKTASAPKLVEQLGITAFPTVIAVSHDSKTAFELIRGYVSISELEEYSVLASKYLKTIDN